MKFSVAFPHSIHETLKSLADKRNESIDQVVHFCLGFAHFVNEAHFAETYNKGPISNELIYKDHSIEIEIDPIGFEICKSFVNKIHSGEECNHDYSFEEEIKTVILIACISYVHWSNDRYENKKTDN